ncbi:hypothetical protein [Corallococcus sp. CA053C]|uniref:hypothetical protein n=1 Tax=Corallococcus sp. CA053C TaxID=2316732 RepID=UPI0011C4A18B|nr:hypothetical protein [Corallococcus sp. CA053C]
MHIQWHLKSKGNMSMGGAMGWESQSSREALDPDFDFRPEMAPTLIGAFLGNLNYEANPFLRTPEEMRKLFFEGIPYELP